MANRLFNPNEQYSDATGTPYVGGQLFFYATGTSTPLSTFSDSALTVPNANPVILDSAGRAGTIFLQNLAYKVVLEDSSNNIIWTEDPVYASDFSTVAQFHGSNGNPNGSLAGTQGSATVSASVAWDYVNNILYVCTTTGTTSTAVWTAVNPASSAAVAPPPQGRLTLITNQPIMSADQVAATTVFYTPYQGLLVPIYNGTNLVPTSIASQLSMGLSSSHAADNIYDFYIFSLSGVPTLGTGPSWSAGTSGNITAGSCARGTGTGGAALSFINGILTNTVSMTIRYGNAGTLTTTVNPNMATYVGTMYVDHTAGQVTCHFTFGQNRKFGIWNAYNRVPIIVQAGDSTASWTYAVNTIRASNNVPSSYSGLTYNVGSGTAANGMTILTGLAEETTTISFKQIISGFTASATPAYTIGVGLNSTTAFSGLQGTINANRGGVGAETDNNSIAEFPLVPSLGINVAACLERCDSVSSTTVNGTSAHMLLSATWRG